LLPLTGNQRRKKHKKKKPNSAHEKRLENEKKTACQGGA